MFLTIFKVLKGSGVYLKYLTLKKYRYTVSHKHPGFGNPYFFPQLNRICGLIFIFLLPPFNLSLFCEVRLRGFNFFKVFNFFVFQLQAVNKYLPSGSGPEIFKSTKKCPITLTWIQRSTAINILQDVLILVIYSKRKWVIL